jgi:transketolase
MRQTFAKTFAELAEKDERLALVCADIFPSGPLEAFKAKHPQRFVNTGVAEQIMIGMCAGMAMKGLKPFAYSIATFALYRPFEFIRNDLAYQNLPVTVVGIGGGVTYSMLGGTHHAMEDVAVASAIPNMRVIAPCDPYETAEATKWCAAQTEGPVYLRLGKAGEPILWPPGGDGWEYGKVRMLRQRGRKTCVVGYGPILKMAMEIDDVDVCSVHTLKPMDYRGIQDICEAYEHVVVLEESVPYLTIELEAVFKRPVRLTSFHLKNRFIHAYGTHDDVRAAHGLTKEALRAAIQG